MGCSGSKSTTVVIDSPLSQALDHKLVDEVISTKRRKSFEVKRSSFNNLMLKMPKLTAGFKRIREAHAAISGPSGKVTWGDFRSVCGEKLGLQPDSESLKEVLDLPGVPKSELVTHPDLILIYTIIFLLDGNARRHSFLSSEIRACLDVMEKSFVCFDSSASGRIERKELALAMKSGTRVFGRKVSKTLADQLFDQLDWSRDGQITFKQFLIGMEQIIIETAGDEDDELGDEEEADMRDLDADWGDDDVKKTQTSDPSPPQTPPSLPPSQQQQQQQQQAGVQTPDEPVADGSEDGRPPAVSATGAV